MKSIDTAVEVCRMLSPCDVAHLGFYRTMEFHYRIAPNYTVMCEGLSRLVSELPEISGHIEKGNDGEFYIAPGQRPLKLSFDQVDEPLADYSAKSLRSDHDINQDLQSFFKEPVDLGGPLLELRLARYGCGGAIVSMRLAHSFADGHGRGLLLRQWAMLSRGLVPPRDLDLDRHAPMALALRDLDTEEDSDTIVMTYGDMARHLAECRNEPASYFVVAVAERAVSNLLCDASVGGTLPITRSDLLTAKLWQVIASLQPSTMQGRLGMPLDIRCRPGVGIGERYVGNALSFCYVDYSVSEIRCDTIVNLAAHLRSKITEAVTPKTVSGLYKRYWKYRHLRESGRLVTSKRNLQAMKEGSLFINNLSRFPVREIDFGTGAPYQVCGIRQPADPSACIFPAPNDGYVIHVNLPQSQARSFSRILETDPFFEIPRR